MMNEAEIDKVGKGKQKLCIGRFALYAGILVPWDKFNKVCNQAKLAITLKAERDALLLAKSADQEDFVLLRIDRDTLQERIDKVLETVGSQGSNIPYREAYNDAVREIQNILRGEE